MGVKLYHNSLAVVFDAKGDSYEVPNYCMHKPHKYIIKEVEYKKIKNVKEETFKVCFYINIIDNYKIWCKF